MAYLDEYNLPWCAGEQSMTRVTICYKLQLMSRLVKKVAVVKSMLMR